MNEPSLLIQNDFVANPDALFAALQGEVEWDERMRARKTASFGVPYNYSQMHYEAAPFPSAIGALLPRIAGTVGFLPNNCLANYYPDGNATMGFHSDSLVGLVPGTGVAIVSLGAPRLLTFRRLDDKSVRWEVALPNGSLLYMPPEVQHEWTHGVLPQSDAGARISLTFRCIHEYPA